MQERPQFGSAMASPLMRGAGVRVWRIGMLMV